MTPQHTGGYTKPQLRRFGTFREMTREGFQGNLDGGLILGPDGNPTPASDPLQNPGGSR
jgi:hypothetical protein